MTETDGSKPLKGRAEGDKLSKYTPMSAISRNIIRNSRVYYKATLLAKSRVKRDKVIECISQAIFKVAK